MLKARHPTRQPLQIITEILLRAGVPMLADIILHYDALDAEYTEMCKDESLPLYQRHAADRGHILFNKYYQKTDKSEMYRLAIRTFTFG